MGTLVSFVYQGPISTKIRVHEQYCQVLPAGGSDNAAALRAVTYPTVHHSIVTLAKLRSGQRIFIQGAGSILGQFGVALAKEIGATIYASIKNEEERTFIQGLGISRERVVNDKQSFQSTTLLGLTDGHGFDVVFNTSGDEEAISQLWLSIAPKGRFVDASNNDESANLSLSAKPFKLGASFEVVNMIDYLASNLDLYTKILLNAAKHSLTFSPKTSTFAIDKIQEALDFVTFPIGSENAWLVFSKEALVPIIPEVKNQLRLRPDGTYVLAGGLGGLGRSLARLMVNSGARHLVFLSRSGPGSAAAKSISEEFAPLGVRIEVFGCDVADTKSVTSVFAGLAKDTSWPPIRGMIQSAAVLRDSIFENMTHAQWTEALRPKVQGTWNLHQASLSAPSAKEGLDFFVMLASISGFVGNRGQANYAAGNSYQDALAKYRHSLGLKATSVDLGLMREIGLIAETGGNSNLSDDTVVPLTAHDFELIFKLAMNSEGHDVPAQIITGLPTGGILQKQGIETQPFYYSDPRFARLAQHGLDTSLTSTSSTSTSVSIEEAISNATSRAEANAAVLAALSTQVAKALRCPPEDIDATKPMHAYGMDSLMAVDMRGWVNTKLKAEISLFDVMSGSSIGVLAEKIAKASKLVKAELE